ncbi:hypothetical protein SADUNF_Sadunf05G0039200 [Salix dunnii]|uniref:Uncharacterized protein n=1 Tax=Salix dunnii TaxID=1413687 RepID=A0A835K3L4_9ROSI|nr:hypothetical protein SADUNF_Sadunf05G0039200 [Salix dunnii]
MKLINTEIGRIEMSTALINDICAWILLAFTITLTENEAAFLASLWGDYSCFPMNSKGLVEMIVLNVGRDQKPLTAISSYCNLAEERWIALITIPFHKQRTVDGGMEVTNPAFRMADQNVLAKAPCPIGILVERRRSEDAIEPDDSGMHIVETENKKGKWCDAEYISEFRIQTAHDESISYNEKAVNNDEETVAE